MNVDKWRYDFGALPLPVWGEGWGEGVTDLSRNPNPSPHPSPSRSRIYPTSAAQIPNSGKPEFGGRGSRSSLPPNRIAYFAQAKATLSRVRVPKRSEERATALPPSAR